MNVIPMATFLASHTKPSLFLVILLQNFLRKMFNVNCYVIPHTLVKQVYPPTKAHAGTEMQSQGKTALTLKSHWILSHCSV